MSTCPSYCPHQKVHAHCGGRCPVTGKVVSCMTLSRTGSEDAMRSPCLHQYAPLVKGLAHKLSYRGESSDLEKDLVSCGLLGLVESVPRYDGSVEFMTFAYLRVRGAMLDELRTRHKYSRRTESLEEGPEISATLRSPEVLAEMTDLRDQIGELPPKWGRVILALLRGVSLKEAGRAVGVSEVRAHQLYGKAVARLVKANTEAT